jgi:integrase/recombinase XerD
MNNYTILCKKFVAHLKSIGRQPATIQAYRGDVQNFIVYLQEENILTPDLNATLLERYQTHLHYNSSKTNSIRRNIISIRQFFRFVFQEQKKISPFDDSIIPQRKENTPKNLVQENIENLLHIAKSHPNKLKSSRDPAIVCLLAFEGIKASEITDLKWTDFLYLKNLGSLKIPGTRERIIHLSNSSSEHLQQYHKLFTNLLNNNSPENKIFIGFKGKNKLKAHPHMTRHGLKFLLYELGDKNKIPHLNAEDLRHHAITKMIQLKKTPEEIQAHLGLKRIGNIAKHIQKSK